MDLIKAYRAYWKNAFNFRDRTKTAGYWWVVFLNVVIGLALLIFMYLSTSGAVSGFVNPLAPLGPVVPIVILVSWPFINLVPGIAITVRRLHDTGRSGWNYLFALIPVIGLFILVVFLTAPTMYPQGNRYYYRRHV